MYIYISMLRYIVIYIIYIYIYIYICMMYDNYNGTCVQKA